MAALVEEHNRTRQDHVLTMEDPVEYIFTPQQCHFTQRQVGPQTKYLRLRPPGRLARGP